MSDSHAHADTGEALSAHVRAEIDHWLAKFPVDRKRSAVIAACTTRPTSTPKPGPVGTLTPPSSRP